MKNQIKCIRKFLLKLDFIALKSKHFGLLFNFKIEFLLTFFLVFILFYL